MKKITVIVPVYNEADNLVPLYTRLIEQFNSLNKYTWRLLFVNDGSTDNTSNDLQNIASRDCTVEIVNLSRNFGKEIALTAGVHEAEDSAAIICMDADLQHPPSLLPVLLSEWEGGSDIVVTIRTKTEAVTFSRALCSKIYYWLLKKISTVEIVPNSTDYRLYDRKVIAAFKHTTERERMFRGIMDWLGFKRSYVKFNAPQRYSGVPTYSYVRLWQLAINSITSFSLWPLRLTGYLGIFISLLSTILFLFCTIADNVFHAFNITAFGYTMILILFLNGVMLSSIGLVALYIGTIHTEVINRPLYIVRDHFRNGEFIV